MPKDASSSAVTTSYVATTTSQDSQEIANQPETNYIENLGETSSSNFFFKRDNLIRIAKLANLILTENEIYKYSQQLSSILSYIDKLKEVDTKNIQETSQTTGLENITSEDETSPSLSQEEALSNTKNKHNGLFKVKGILNNE